MILALHILIKLKMDGSWIIGSSTLEHEYIKLSIQFFELEMEYTIWMMLYVLHLIVILTCLKYNCAIKMERDGGNSIG